MFQIIFYNPYPLSPKSVVYIPIDWIAYPAPDLEDLQDTNPYSWSPALLLPSLYVGAEEVTVTPPTGINSPEP